LEEEINACFNLAVLRQQDPLRRRQQPVPLQVEVLPLHHLPGLPQQGERPCPLATPAVHIRPRQENMEGQFWLAFPGDLPSGVIERLRSVVGTDVSIEVRHPHQDIGLEPQHVPSSCGDQPLLV